MVSNRCKEMDTGRKTQVCKDKGKTNSFKGAKIYQEEAWKLSLEHELVT